MKLTIGLVLGFLAGLAIYRAPYYRLFQDEPETPEGHTIKTRYWNGGVEVEWPKETP